MISVSKHTIRSVLSPSVNKHHSRGFTLVELLIVITLMMLAVGLVAPIGLNMVDKANKQQNIILLKTLYDKTSHISFINAQPAQLHIDQNKVVIYQREQIVTTHVLDSLSSEDKQVVLFNRNGLASLNELRLLDNKDNPTMVFFGPRAQFMTTTQSSGTVLGGSYQGAE